jgi:hypothetical protein
MAKSKKEPKNKAFSVFDQPSGLEDFDNFQGPLARPLEHLDVMVAEAKITYVRASPSP